MGILAFGVVSKGGQDLTLGIGQLNVAIVIIAFHSHLHAVHPHEGSAFQLIQGQDQGVLVHSGAGVLHHFHGEGCGLSLISNGEGLGANGCVFETGNHSQGQVDFVGGIIIVAESQFTAGDIQFIPVLAVLGLDRLGSDSNGSQTLGLNLHMEGIGLFSQGNGQLLLAYPGIIKAGDHILGQVDLFLGTVVIVQGDLTAGQIQSVLTLQIGQLGGKIGQADRGQALGLDLHIEGGSLAGVGNSQGILAQNSVVKARNHVLGEFHLCCGAVIVVQGDLTAGDIQSLLILQVTQLLRQAAHSNGGQSLGLHFHGKGESEAAVGDRQFLTANLGVVETCDHGIGQRDLLGGFIVIGQLQHAAGDIQLILAFQIRKLGRLFLQDNALQLSGRCDRGCIVGSAGLALVQGQGSTGGRSVAGEAVGIVSAQKAVLQPSFSTVVIGEFIGAVGSGGSPCGLSGYRGNQSNVVAIRIRGAGHILAGFGIVNGPAAAGCGSNVPHDRGIGRGDGITGNSDLQIIQSVFAAQLRLHGAVVAAG